MRFALLLLALSGLSGPALETEIFDRVNRQRVSAGAAALHWDPRLAAVARSHSAEMARRRFLAHELPATGTLRDRFAAAGVPWRRIAENLYVVYGPPFEVRRPVEEWMRSPGHRRNLLNRVYTHTGVGISSRGGDTYVTQVFAAY